MAARTEKPAPQKFRLAPDLRVPLSVKIGLWLGLNFLLVAAIAGGVLLGRGGLQGWIGTPIGDRLQLVVVAVNSAALNGEDLESVIARFEADYDLSFAFFSNRGEYIAGADVPLPEEVEYILKNDSPGDGQGAPPRREGPRADGPGPDPRPAGLGDRPPPPPEQRQRRPGDGPPPRRGPDGGGPNGGRNPPPADSPRGMESGGGPSGRDGRIFEYDGEEGRWWIGVRAPVFDAEGRPRPAAFFAITDSAWSFGGLLDTRPTVYAVAAVMVLSVLFWLPLVFGITRALRQAVHATTEISLGRFDVRVETKRRDELGLLGESINRMAERLDRLVNGQKKFLADVAHELGSPLGRLQVGAAILQDRVSDDLQESVKDVQDEVQQMGELLGELLDFTKAGLKAREAAIQPVLLIDAVTEAIRREAIGGSIDVEVDESTVVGGDASLLVKVISNVVRNAIRYAGTEAKIVIASEISGNGRVVLRISDDGPGVPPEALSRLGEAFYRPDSARNRAAGGTGLGLSIVRESIEAMGGVVRFSNGSPRGFVVTIELNQELVS